ncbi:MAG TPA: hypothetical protein VKX25_05670 [Bryobacteraceae bacterium]|nr:hypothetical protein [Bryobacteraceae bacterium]
MPRCRSFCIDNAPVLLASAAFCVLLLLVNWQLFTTPLIENGDHAANAIQVQNAEHFRELLGNYSRWHFHHPGPFFFYLFAAGELVFYKLLHVVPAPLNGEYLAQLLFNVGCLFASIFICQKNVKARLFPALSVAASALFLYVVYAAIPYSAMIPIWPPYMSIFSFLLLAVAAASVGAGNWEHLPWMALAGMMMIHAHVAQFFFAPILWLASLVCLVLHERREGDLVAVIRRERKRIIIAGAIVLLFLLPIALDYFFDHPNNLHQIRAYLREHHGYRNTARITFLYVASFFTFFRTPEIALANPSATLAEIANPQLYVSAYWSIYFFLALFAVVSYFGRLRQLPLFLRLIFSEAVLILLLFTYWSSKITGGMFNFNGFFFFSVQLLVLFALCAIVAYRIGIMPDRRTQIALASACAAPVLLISSLDIRFPSDPNVLPIVALVKANHPKQVAIVQSNESWPTAAGIASYLERSGIDFCVEPDWEFTFGRSHVCTNAAKDFQIDVSLNNPACKGGACSVIYHSGNLYVTLRPPA